MTNDQNAIDAPQATEDAPYLVTPAAIGIELEVTLVAPRSDRDWSVTSTELRDAGLHAAVRFQSGRDPERGEVVRGWIGEVTPARRQLILFVSDFGRLPISDGQRARYRLALDMVANLPGADPDATSHGQISEFKGMLNRCIRHDQRDWLAVWDLFGRPDVRALRGGVLAAERTRDAVRGGALPATEDLSLLQTLASGALERLDADRVRLAASRTTAAMSGPTVDQGPARVQAEVDLQKTRHARSLHERTLAVLF